MHNNNQNILITGGAGYIGSHTAKGLARAGLRPIVLDNLERGHREAVQWGPLIEADLSNRAALAQVFQDYRISAVIHFAAYAYVGESMQRPERYFRNNVVNSLNLLDAMHAAGLRRIVFSSSCATYGTPQQIPIPESHPQQPVNPYGESKLMVENLLRWYSSIYGFSCVSLRYFNAAGADPDGEIGEDHEPETHLIPLAISAAMGWTDYLEIFGTDYPTTPDGTAIRDYLHVSDLAEAHVSALQQTEASGFQAFNLGTGKGHSVREVISAVERLANATVPFREAARRAGDPPCLVADASRAAAVLRWTPRHSSLDEIVRTAWQWKTKHHTECRQAAVR